MYVGERPSQQPAVARRVDPGDRHQLAHGERSGKTCSSRPVSRSPTIALPSDSRTRPVGTARPDATTLGSPASRLPQAARAYRGRGSTTAVPPRVAHPRAAGGTGPTARTRRLRTRSARRRSARTASSRDVRAPTRFTVRAPGRPPPRVGAVPHLSLAPDEPLHVLVPSRRSAPPRKRCPRGSTPASTPPTAARR